jgi:hypothetical protein
MEPEPVCRMVCTTLPYNLPRTGSTSGGGGARICCSCLHFSNPGRGFPHFSYDGTATLLLRLESLSSSMVMSRESSHYVVTCHPPGAVLKTVKCHFLSKDSQVSVVASSRQVSLFVGWLVCCCVVHSVGRLFSLLSLTFYYLHGKNLSSVGCRHCQIETIGSPTMARLGSRQGRRRQCYRRRRRS